MKIFSLNFIAMSLLGVASCEQEKISQADMAVKALPHWAVRSFEKPAFKSSYTFDTSINPFYLNVDVDGNQTIDIAAVVVDKASGRRGVAILQHESDSVHIFGAGKPNSLGGNNWNWLVGWKAEERLTAGSAVQKNVGTALILFTETGGANWMYWDGKEWEWVSQ